MTTPNKNGNHTIWVKVVGTREPAQQLVLAATEIKASDILASFAAKGKGNPSKSYTLIGHDGRPKESSDLVHLNADGVSAEMPVLILENSDIQQSRLTDSGGVASGNCWCCVRIR